MAVSRPPSWDGNAFVTGPALQVGREGTSSVVSLGGEQDMSTAAAVAEALAGAIAEDDDDVVVDLSQVRFMDGAIVTVIVHAWNDLRSRSRDLTLRAPSPCAERLLRLCGLQRLIDPAPTIAEDGTVPGTTERGGPTPAPRPGAAGRHGRRTDPSYLAAIRTARRMDGEAGTLNGEGMAIVEV